MRLIICAAALAAVLTGCASGVRLDDVPVEDKSPSAVGAGGSAGAGANTGAVSKSAVPTVDAGRSDNKAALAADARVVYFDYDSFVIKPEFQAIVETHARFLKADATRKLVIEGHTDERGGREYNLALGQKRAEAVRQALSLLGVDEPRLEAVSFGKEKPAASGSDEASMAKNRRAELRLR